jgi:hypothetical protein
MAEEIEKLDLTSRFEFLEKSELWEECRKPMLQAAYKWFRDIREGIYKTVHEIRKLLPDHIWKRYEEWGGFDDHQEVVLLKQRQVAFRKALVSKNRPDLFKKGKRNSEIKEVSQRRK